MMITHTRAASANGSSHTISAMSQPAKTPRSSVVAKPARSPSWPMRTKASPMPGSNAVVRAATKAKASAPARLASSTVVHSRATLRNVWPSFFCSSGRITVSVFSVKSCCRPRTTMRKPTL